MTLGTADELFAQPLADDATPSPEETVAFMVDAVMERAVHHPVLGVDMSRVALHAWAEALRDTDPVQYLSGVRALLAGARG
jgi:hypothetical protein